MKELLLKSLPFVFLFLMLPWPLVTATSSEDSFDYALLTKEALKHIESELLYFEELKSKDAESSALLGVWPADLKEELTKMEASLQYQALEGIQSCLEHAGTLGHQKVWDEIAGATSGSGALECAQTGGIFAGTLAAMSAHSVADYATVEKPHYFNPAFSALIQIYKNKASFSPDTLNERVLNTLGQTAYRRESLGLAMMDLARIQKRLNTNPKLNPYYLETLMDDDEKNGLRVLASCMKEYAPLSYMYLLVEQHKEPDDAFLFSYSCLNPTGQDGSKDSRLRNFKRMGIVMVKPSALLMDSQTKKPLFQAWLERPPKQAGDTFYLERIERVENNVYAIDNFVNNHIAAMRQSLYTAANNRPSETVFKGISEYSGAEQIIITDLFQRRLLDERHELVDQARVRKFLLESSPTSAQSCLIAAAQQEAVGSAAGLFLRQASQKLPGAWKFAVFALGTGMMVKGFLDSYDETKKLAAEYNDLKPDEATFRFCTTFYNAAMTAWDTAEFSLSAPHVIREGVQYFKNRKNEGTLPDVKNPDNLDASQRQTQSKSTQRLVGEQYARQAAEPGGVPKAEQKYADEFGGAKKSSEQPPAGTKPDPETEVPKSSESSEAQAVRSAIHDQGGDVTPAVVENYQTLVRKQKKLIAGEINPTKKAKAEADYQTLRQKAVREIYASTITNPDVHARTLVIQRPDGSMTMVFHPKNPGDPMVHPDVETQYNAFSRALRTAEIDDVSVNPSSRNVLVDTSDAVLRAAFNGDDSVAAYRLLRDMYNSKMLAGGADQVSFVKTKRRELLESLAASIPPERRATFEDVRNDLLDMDSLGVKPGGVQKARDRVKALAETDALAYSESLQLMAALDPDIPDGIDLFGAHEPLFSSLSSPQGVQAVREMSRVANFQEAKAAREYSEKLELGLIISSQTLKSGQPKIPSDALDYVMKHYGVEDLIDAAGPNKAVADVFLGRMNDVRKINNDFSGAIEKTLADLSLDGKPITLDDVDSIVLSPDVEKIVDGKKISGLLGSGGFRAAYSFDIKLKDGSTKTVVGKIGFTHPREVDLLKKWHERRFAPETYGFIEGEHGGLFFQERIDAPSLRKVITEGSASEVTSAAKAVAAVDGALAFAGKKTDANGNLLATHLLDLGAENILVDGGRAFIIDADPKFLMSRPLDEYFSFMLIYRDLYFKGNDFDAYLSRLHDVFRRELGVSQGDALFVQVMKKSRDEIANGGGFQLFSKYAQFVPDDVADVYPDFENGNLHGTREFIGYISQGQYLANANPGADYTWDRRVPAAIDAYIASIGR